MGVAYNDQKVSAKKLSEFAAYDYYPEKWEKSVSFNAGAFFFTFVWLAYRKMYLFSFLYYLLSAVVFFVLGELGISWLYGIVLFVIMGFIGNRLYLHFAENKIARISSMYSDPDEQRKRIVQAGGTNFGAAFFVGVVYVALFIGVYGSY
ncbi:DUF2628 domain-containing protein [Paenibacillus lactis]|uniref:DUF2628 domain-containing protein n=1 Tax=Paenibacillus lactis TaxID=228574 RepID=UPI0020408634|nr:DUF2628 domain-containing protein [Paenibacillus lactis]